MRNDFCSNYLEHANWKNHKYVEKVKLSNGKYHYFYSVAEYQAYLKGQGINDGSSGESTDNKGQNAKANPKQDALNAIKSGTSTIEQLKANNFNTKATDKAGKEKELKSNIENGQKKIDSALSKSKSSKNSSGSSGSSKKKGSSKKGSSSKSKSSKAKTEKQAKEKTSSSKEKTSSKKTTDNSATLEALAKVEAAAKNLASGGKVTASNIKSLFGIKDSNITKRTGSANEIKKAMESTYKDGAFGYLTVGSDDSSTKVVRWFMDDGEIKLTDPDTNKEISFTEVLKDSKDIQEFRTDKKRTK